MRSSLGTGDEQIIATILLHEGSTYTNDPTDAGGPTKYGITLAELSAWRGHSCTADDVRDLSRDEAAAIYRARYLRPFDMVIDPLRTNVIDFGVNAGVRRATFTLQAMVGATVDGWIGAETVRLTKVRSATAWNDLYVGFRLAFYEHLIEIKPTQVKFRGGWRNRAFSFLSTQPAALRRAARVLPMAKAYL
jgi:lysozyme family protein